MLTSGKHQERVVVRPMGGLGNQLFIYGAGLSIAEHWGVSLIVDPSWFLQSSERNFHLTDFYSDDRVSFHPTQTLNANIYTSLSRVSTHLSGFWWDLVGPARSISRFNESKTEFQESIYSIEPPLALNGYFHSWKYLEPSKSNLRSSIRNLKDESPWLKDTRRTLNGLGRWASIHVRRGDFLSQQNRANHGVLGANYYTDAIHNLRDKEGSISTVLFTDDISSARDALPIDFTPDYVINDSASHSDLESLILMSEASALITANSTFSWWAAWLGETDSRQVFVPTPWTRSDGYQLNDFLEPSWHGIDSHFSD